MKVWGWSKTEVDALPALESIGRPLFEVEPEGHVVQEQPRVSGRDRRAERASQRLGDGYDVAVGIRHREMRCHTAVERLRAASLDCSRRFDPSELLT